jgi:hypothetical protein
LAVGQPTVRPGRISRATSRIPATFAEEAETVGLSMTDTPKIHTESWRSYPHQTVDHAAVILICSRGQVYNLLNRGKLEAVRLNGRTAITTTSIETLLEQAKPWEPARDRVEKANEVRLGRLASAPKPARRRIEKANKIRLEKLVGASADHP